DVSSIDTAVNEMNTAWTAASEEMYKATQQAGANGGNGHSNAQQPNEGQEEHANAGAGDNVTDAEFEEVK
ncbi:MAG TPA: molecular chaperone DnaK, partial [Ginsengibacter sp.]